MLINTYKRKPENLKMVQGQRLSKTTLSNAGRFPLSRPAFLFMEENESTRKNLPARHRKEYDEMRERLEYLLEKQSQ